MICSVRLFLFSVILFIGVGFTPDRSTVSAGVIAALGLDANIGVDEATRAWLSTLPQTWRDQINKIVEDTLTSANMHLDEALTSIRKQLAAAEDEAACKWLGTNLQTIELWKSQLPFLKQPEPIRDLGDYIQSQRKAALDHHLDPQYMQWLYDDLENKVAVIRCEPTLSPGSKVNLESTTAYLSNRWIIWRRMESIKCGFQDTCFANYRLAVQNSINDALKIDGLDDGQKEVITKAKTDLASAEPPSAACGFFQRFYKENCYDIEDYEEKLFTLGDIDDRVRLLVATHNLHEKLDSAVLTTQDVDPGTLKPGATLKSPNNTYFAVMQANCNFQIYKGPYTTAAERLAPKYVVANTATGNSSYANCHLDIQRDRNVVVFADVTTNTPVVSSGPMIRMGGGGIGGGMTFPTPTVRMQTSVAPNSVVWSSSTGDAGNADYWLILRDNGLLELRAGKPFADGGPLFTSRLLANKALQFVKATKP